MSFRRVMLAMAAMLVGVLPGSLHAQRAQRAMSIKLLPPLYDQPLRFVLNQPAYVAAFVVSPGEGVRMIYPLVNSAEKLQWAGFHNESLIGLHFDDDAYDVVFGRVSWRGYPASFAGQFTGPRYLYIVASRTPLDVSRFVHRPMELQRTVGYAAARSFDSDDAFNALLNNVVSLGSDDSWDSDVYMLWAPEWSDEGPHSFDEALRWNMETRLLVCRDGSSRLVPLNYWFSGCPGDARLLLTRPVKPPVEKVASNLESPTVLPTIRGVRLARKPEAKTEPTVNGFLTTAAGGVSENGVRLIDRGNNEDGVQTLTVTEVPALVIERGEPRRRSLREREEGDRGSDQRWAARRSGPVVGSYPEMAPAPRLAPNPTLSPNPMASPAPRMAPAPNVRPERVSSPRFDHPAPVAAPAPRAEPVHSAPAPAAAAPATSSAPGTKTQ